MKKRPFEGYYELHDVCHCSGKRCKKKYDCLRYMAKKDGVYSQTTFNPKDCDYFYPMKVWGTYLGRRMMLSEITDQHLMAIIVHLYERKTRGDIITGNFDKIIAEFTKEAIRRKLMESVLYEY